MTLNWIQVGTVTPNINDWENCGSILNGELLRFTYTCNWNTRTHPYASYGLGKFVYPSNPVIHSLTFKLWPTPNLVIKEFKLPQYFIDINFVLRDIWIKRVNRSRYDLGSLDPVWSIKVEYL